MSLADHRDDVTDIDSALLSPDEQRVVYTTRQPLEDGRRELWSVPTTGGTPVRLVRDAQVGGGGVVDLQITADSSSVVFTSRPRADNPGADLYVVPTGGGVPQVLTQVLDFGATVVWFDLAPDGNTVVYSVQGADFRVVLYAVPLTGGIAVPLSADVAGAYPQVVGMTNDGQVAYVDVGWSLLATPLSGGTPARLTAAGETVAGGAVGAERAAVAIGDRVAFLSDRDGDGYASLFSVRATGGGRLQLKAGRSGDAVERIVAAPDDLHVVLTATPEYRLATVAASGGPVTTFEPTGVIGDGWSPMFSPDGDAMLFVGSGSPAPVDGPQLWSAPTDGSGPAVVVVELQAGFVGATFVAGGPGVVVSDGGRLLFVSRPGTPPRPLRNVAEPNSFVISDDGTRVIYLHHDTATIVASLRSVPLSGGTDVLLNDPADPDQTGISWYEAAGDHIIYQARYWEGGFPHALYRVKVGWACRGRWANLVGTAGADEIRGTRRPDMIAALGGADVVDGRGGADVICGGAGSDTLSGGSGQDLVDGQGGRDDCTGEQTIRCENAG